MLSTTLPNVSIEFVHNNANRMEVACSSINFHSILHRPDEKLPLAIEADMWKYSIPTQIDSVVDFARANLVEQLKCLSWEFIEKGLFSTEQCDKGSTDFPTDMKIRLLLLGDFFLSNSSSDSFWCGEICEWVLVVKPFHIELTLYGGRRRGEIHPERYQQIYIDT